MESIRIYDRGQNAQQRHIVFFMDRAHSRAEAFFQQMIWSATPEDKKGTVLLAYAKPGSHLGERVKFSELDPRFQACVLKEVDADRNTLSSSDYGLNAQALADRYTTKEGGWGKHPNYTREVWRREVDDGNVQSGYWDWVAHELQIERDEFQDFVNAGVGDPTQDDASEYVVVRRSDLVALQESLTRVASGNKAEGMKTIVDGDELLKVSDALNAIAYSEVADSARPVQGNPSGDTICTADLVGMAKDDLQQSTWNLVRFESLKGEDNRLGPTGDRLESTGVRVLTDGTSTDQAIEIVKEGSDLPDYCAVFIVNYPLVNKLGVPDVATDEGARDYVERVLGLRCLADMRVQCNDSGGDPFSFSVDLLVHVHRLRELDDEKPAHTERDRS